MNYEFKNLIGGQLKTWVVVLYIILFITAWALFFASIFGAFNKKENYSPMTQNFTYTNKFDII